MVAQEHGSVVEHKAQGELETLCNAWPARTPTRTFERDFRNRFALGFFCFCFFNHFVLGYSSIIHGKGGL